VFKRETASKELVAVSTFKKLELAISRILSRTVIHLGNLSPSFSSNLPGSIAGHDFGTLFGLASGGVYPATDVATSAVRSYRTISPLPNKLGGIFSVALSIGSRLPGVTWHLTL